MVDSQRLKYHNKYSNFLTPQECQDIISIIDRDKDDVPTGSYESTGYYGLTASYDRYNWLHHEDIKPYHIEERLFNLECMSDWGYMVTQCWCNELKIGGIPALGFANPEMKTLILNTNSNSLNFVRVLHHEIFHVIEYNYKNELSSISWNNLNSNSFKYSECSTCSNSYSLDRIYNSNGFVSEYAKSTISEDMAETFSFMMSDNSLILDMITNDQILNKKVMIIKNIIKEIDDNHQF